ncbi:MAG: hypothetical protein CML06_18675 [Pseudomonadales bacterium]|nr:hypothetical protein [Pseudomonadales bacterium]
MVDALEAQVSLAVDTEFVRTNTYFSQPGLIQIAARDEIYLVDPTAFQSTALQTLGQCLFAPGRQLLMHSAGEDLDLFLHLWQSLPDQLFDTQIAAGFVGYDRQMGLQRLLEQVLGVQLDKEVTRSDWLQRPLSPRQLSYAEADVRHLDALAEHLSARLQQLNRLHWFREECQQLVAKYRHKTPDEELYLGFSAGWKLAPEQQAALRHLARWREQTARERNIPKTFIAKDAQLYGLVEKQPNNRGELAELGFGGGQIRRFGAVLLQELEQGLQQPPPARLIPRPLSKAQQKDYKRLRDLVAQQAAELQLPSNLLASKAQLTDYIKARTAGTLDREDPFQGSWREPILRPPLDGCVLTSEKNQPEDADDD